MYTFSHIRCIHSYIYILRVHNVIMQILYLYDIKAKNKREFNRVKRVFYYRLNKLGIVKLHFVTKSVLLVPHDLERLLDAFFLGFKKSVEVYKAKCEKVEEL